MNRHERACTVTDVTTESVKSARARFHQLHERETFILPNPWDVGSAKLLVSLGFSAIATTSAGHAASIGKLDSQVTFEELLEHAALIAASVDVPINVDSERLFAETPDGVAANVGRVAETGAAGCSIEDWDPVRGAIDSIELATERVAAAAQSHGLVLTARAENHLHGVHDIDDTIARLRAYRAAGAHAVYAPGLLQLDVISRVVSEVDAPLNVLSYVADGPTVAELASVGVRRVSTGSSLAMVAYGAFVAGARELLETGTSRYVAQRISGADLTAAMT